MTREFIPYEQALALKELGFDETCFAYYKDMKGEKVLLYDSMNFDGECNTPLYQQAFRWFREKYGFTYSIGNTNIAVIHYGPTTQLLQDNESYEAAQLAAIKWFIDVAKQI